MTSKPKIRQSGFALVVTLTLMILLTILAVGLLTLSTVSLRSTGHGDSAAIAKSNARLALMLAIGQLQKTAGPDKRITAPANLVDESNQPGITGVWNSWRPPSSGASSSAYTSAKTGNNFLGYLMSDNQFQSDPNPAKVPEGSGDVQKLIGSGSLGSAAAANSRANEINCPIIETRNGTSGRGGLAWVTLDEGVKGRIDLEPAETPSGQGESITSVGSPARNGFESADGMEFLSEDDDKLRESLPKLVSLNEVNLKTADRDTVGKYFHDFTVSSSSVQADVANGGLKTDLSVVFEGTYESSVPAPYATKYLYSDSTTPFQGTSTTSDIQWGVYAKYARLYRKTTANDNAKDGLKALLPPGYSLRTISDSVLKAPRYEPNMAQVKSPMFMPTVVRVDMVFSLVTRPAHAGRFTTALPYMLHMMYLPVVTLHNPYNVPLRFREMHVEFADLPIGFEFLVNGQPSTTNGLIPLNNLYAQNTGITKIFKVGLSGDLNAASDVVMGAGETRIFGKPFPPDHSWGADLALGEANFKFFDWQNKTMTSTARCMPGMITGPTDGIGYDVDWLAPDNRAPWLIARRNDGVIMLNATDVISVRFGPKIPATATGNKFAVKTYLNNVPVGHTQAFYLNDARLRAIVQEGTSPRYADPRNFPETFPKGGAPITTMKLLEADSTKISDYVNAQPFAIFSLGAKTTMDAYTKSRPVTDTGITMQMATCDFTTSASQGSSPLEFALTPVKNGTAAIESTGNPTIGNSVKGYFFGGHGATRGSSSAVFYEIPLAPLQSIAQLRHANAASLGSMPYFTYSIGESRSHPAVPSSAPFQKVNAARMNLDHSWLANDQLWDKYWFSTLSTLQGPGYSGSSAIVQNQLANAFFAGTRILPNPRNLAYVPPGKPVTEIVSEATIPNGPTAGVSSAAYMMTRGGFNVNSTSVAAWTSVLSSLANCDVPLVGGSNEKLDKDKAAFLRIRRPGSGQSSSLPTNDKIWNAYQTLDGNQIETLAREIVKQVRDRGPFLSMAEFVNRQLGSSALSQAGAIQAAIDASDLGSPIEGNSRAVSSGDVSSYGWANSEAISGNTGTGAPGEITQGDILSTIGSFVTVRSDTFRIRAYGDARDKNGAVISRAWCEATLQRVPEYVDPTDSPVDVANNSSNVNFGRRFQIVSFRWLHPEEV